MDRSWMKASRISDKCENEVEQSLEFTKRNAPCIGRKFFYPCVKCGKGRCQIVNDKRSHIM